jgi:D-alanyl-lipoteichoic acid acyltransferase DltB (MBOAT superfamily)
VNFDTFDYILLFLPVVFISCNLARRIPVAKAPQICILLGSTVFYAWSKPSHLAYILGSIVVNWQIARLIGNAAEPWRKRYLQAGLVLNLGFLCTFKYVNFFLSNIPYLADHHFQAPNLAFPLGISFFTLTQIMYLVDCYEDLVPPSSLFDHATFVSFFPYVISGPISRAKRILHQFPSLNGTVGPSSETIARAVYLFTIGLIKKVVLADAFSKAADYGFGNIGTLSTFEAWCFASSFALQMYFDFSGYSDMAIASALFLGIEIPRNFDGPYRATSIIEFWKRWHITLTSFITTYIYTPLLRSLGRATLATSAVATMFAMTLAGLWHGPNWTFVIFGAIHGTGLAVNQYWRKKRMPEMPKLVGWILTAVLVDIAFIFFRSPTMQVAGLFLSRLFGWHQPWGIENLHKMNGVGPMLAVLTLSQFAGIVAVFCRKSSDELAREFKPTWSNYATTTAYALIAFLYLNSNVARPFLYFAF